MEIKVKGLVAKTTVGGIRYYWEPTPFERNAGWKTLRLGQDLNIAIVAAEQRNGEIQDWKANGARPRAVEPFIKKQTLRDGISRYRHEHLANLAESTRRTAATPLKRLDIWAGDKPLSFITRTRVRKLRDAMMDPLGPGYLGHHAAFAVLAKGRELFTWMVDQEIAAENPFLRFGLGKPAPRQVFWEDPHFDAINAAALELKLPSIALAIDVGAYIGQREADVLKLASGRWDPIKPEKFRFDMALYEALKSNHGPNAGEVMGIYVRQGKTKRWIGVPIEGDMRDRIEAAINANRRAAIGTTALIVCERTGLPWTQDHFIHKFGEVRARAVETAINAGNQDLAAEIADLWFNDLRRTCVVRLGELGLDDAAIAAITGHKLGTIKTILETYMPRTEAMAARAVVARMPTSVHRTGQVKSG